MLKNALFIFVFLGCISLLYGQDCGTIASQDDVNYINRFIKNGNSLHHHSNGRLSSSTAFVEIPIKFHFVVQEEGDLGATDEQADALLAKMNTIYAPASMGFFHVGEYNRIVDPDNYNFDSPNEGAVAVGNEVRNTINVFFFGTARSNGSPVCGYARFPGNGPDRIVVAYSCVLGGATTLEHELGHYFSLYHTHGKTNNGTTDERVDGSNCTVAGDDICDTPADPNLSGKVTNCVYNGGETDANGEGFQPDPSNIMAYSPDACQDYFSPGQFERIRNGFENGRNYLDFVTDDLVVNFSFSSSEGCIGDEIMFSSSGFGVTDWEWEFEGGNPATSTDPNPTVSYATGGLFDVSLTGIANGGERVTFTREDLIFIDDPLSRLIDDGRTNNFDNNEIDSDIVVDNPDNFLTFELVNINSSNDAGYSLLVDNFNYDAQNLPQSDKLQFLPLQTSGLKGVRVKLKAAYQSRRIEGDDLIIINDSLKVNLKTSCSSEGISLINTGGLELAGGINSPVANNSSVRYTPSSPDEWVEFSEYYTISDGDEFVAIDIESVGYNGNSLYLDDIDVIPDYSVNAPTGLIAELNANTVTLEWEDNSANELGFTIERSLNTGDFEVIGQVNSSEIEYTDNTVVSGNQYAYRVFANGYDTNVSATSNEVQIDANVLSVDQVDQLVLYPNPVKRYLNIELEDIEEVIISDLSGKSMRVEITGNRIDMINLTSGIYLIDIKTQDKTYKSKIVKE